ncbi:hypothetical protein V6N12_042406 [Hibiscus sabdariffa]|uniref:Uncharacterized protein n=1 Tax=Hibiscus sabdariffa TaxID=183260 RepID=A0ABR2EGC2_9ROSI
MAATVEKDVSNFDHLPRYQQKREKRSNVGFVVYNLERLTKDPALIIHGSKLSRDHYLNTEEFIDIVTADLKARLSIKAYILTWSKIAREWRGFTGK